MLTTIQVAYLKDKKRFVQTIGYKHAAPSWTELADHVKVHLGGEMQSFQVVR